MKSNESTEITSESNQDTTHIFMNDKDKRSPKVLEALKVLEHEKQIEEKIEEKRIFRKWSGSDI